MGNTDLVDKTVASGKYDINASCNGLTPLHLAIKWRRTKMVKHLLQPPMNADPTTRNDQGRNALHVAVRMYGMKEEIIDLLLAHDKVKLDDVDENGQTALHLAASFHFHLSNVVNIFQKLLEKGANPNITDKWGQSPLHVAAKERDGNEIIDILLEAQKVKGMGDVNDRDKHQGRTALHYAAAYSNEITAEHLIKKGADLHCRANAGLTPLDMAALGAKDMKIIDLLLQNINEGDIEQYRNDERLFFFARHNLQGLGDTILDRLVEKGIKPPCTETDDCITAESDEATGVNTRRFVLDKGVDPSIDLTGFDDGLDFLITRVKKSLGIYDNINGRNQNGESLLLGGRIANRLKEKGVIERKIEQVRENIEFFFFAALLKYTSRNAEDEIERVLSDRSVPIEDKIARINEKHLISAIQDSDVERIRLLLKNGTDISRARGEYGMNALHVASHFAKTTDVIDVILETGKFDINGVDNDGETSISWAIRPRDTNCEINARHLIGKGADPTIANKKGDTPLHFAAKNAKEIETINLILENEQVDINSRGKNGWTALHRAIEASNVITLRYLLKKGADPNAATENGATPLHLAAKYDNHYETTRSTPTELINIILETGKCNINGVDNNGRTPLHYAIEMYPVTINVRRLIQLGADPGIADKNGVTPLHMAARNAKSMDLIDELLLKVKTGAVDMNCVDKQGRTPLAYAQHNYHGLGESIIARLKEYGAKE